MSQSNRERVDRELERLNRNLKPFVVGQMRSRYGASWQQEAAKVLSDPHWRKTGELHLDEQALLHILRNQWEHMFHERLKLAEQQIINELLGIRNKWAHRRGVITDTDVNRLLKNMEHLLAWIDSTNASTQSTLKQTNTTRANPMPVIQSFPYWQDLPSSPVPARMPDQPIVSRRTILIATGVMIIGGALCLCTESLPRSNTLQPDPTGAGQQPTPTPLNQPLFTYTGHAKSVNAVVWSPDGQRIASGSDDTTVQVWNASNGSHLFTYHGHSDGVSSVAWSPGGKRIASGSGDLEFTGDAQVWNASDGSQAFTYTGHSEDVETVAWSPDSKRIASGSFDDTVQVWDASNGGNAFTYQGHTNGVWSIAWSPDGRRIVSCGNDGVRVWNASDGGNAFIYQGHSGWVNAVAWSPDGQQIASGSWDNTVQVWNASDGTHVFTYPGHSNVVTSVAWSPDGKRIASGSWDNTVQVWNASDGGNALTYQGHSANVHAVAWSPDGQRIASGSEDQTVQVWQAV